MTLFSSGMSDQALGEMVASGKPETIADAVALMQSIDALLAENDGLKWFNRMYLMVTREVNEHPPGGTWKNPVWLERLDVVFAGFYFEAIGDAMSGGDLAASWRALFEARFDTRIDRIQFAVAGMNAHINHDLALALLKTDADLGVVPEPDGAEHRDYESVNQLLNSVMPAVLNMLATDALGYLAQDAGKIGRILAYWNICRARDLAWDFADHLRGLKGSAYDAAVEVQDALSGALGRAILAQI